MKEEWLTHEELLRLLEQERQGRTLRQFATALGGVPFQQLGGVLTGKRPPGKRIPEALGYDPVTVYRRRKKAGAACSHPSKKQPP